MRTLFLLLPLLGLAIATPAPYTDRQILISKIWGVDSDFGISRAALILGDEAKRFGISSDSFLEECKADAGRITFTEEKKVIVKDGERAKKELATIDVESKDEVLKVIEKHLPKSYAIFAKRLEIIKEYMPRLDADSQKYLRDTGDTMLEMFFKLSKAPEDSPIEQYSVVAMDVKKIVDDFIALPQSSKSALERAFCSRATFRIIDVGGEYKSFIKGMYQLAEEQS